MLKKYSSMLILLVTLSLSINNSLNGLQTSGLDTDEQTISSEIQKATCIKSIDDLRKNLLSVLDKLYGHLDYWQKAHYRPFGYFIEKGPSRWLFGQNQTTEIRNSIELINHEIIRNAHYLGYINELEKNLENASALNIEEHIKTSAYALRFILNFTKIDELTDCTSLSEDLNTLLIENTIKIKRYKKEAQKLFKEAQIPGHMQRHWVGYSLSAICALAGLGYYLKNKDRIAQLVDEGKGATSNFYTDYIATPIKNSLDIIYRKKEDKPLITPEDITIDKEILRKELTDYCNDHKKYCKKYTNDQLKDLINQAVESNSLPEEVMNDFTQQVKNPAWNVISPYGQIVRLFFLAQFQPLKMRVNEGFLKIDRVFKANELNFELLVALPATALVGLASYLSYKSIKGIYHWFSPKKEFLYKPIKHALITVETILNAHLHEPFSFSVNGQLHYWHNQLSRAVPLIPLASRAKFVSDSAELDDVSLTTAQKLNTVQRMFRAYEFLK